MTTENKESNENKLLNFGSLGFLMKINSVLSEVEKGINADGGYLELHSVEGKTIKLSLKGACVNCPSSQMTIKYGIEKRLRDEIDPEIEVIAIS